MKKVFVLLVFFVMFAVTAKADENATLSVSGNGIVKAIPDTASINIAVISQNTDSAQAMLGLSKKASNVVKALSDFGIKKSDISTVNLSLNPVYQYDDKNKTDKLIGYKAKETFNIKASINDIGFLLGKISGFGIDEVNSINFESSNISSLKLQAIQKAMNDAFLKAQSALTDTNYKINGIKSISIADRTPVPVYFNKLAMSNSNPNVPIESGTINIEASVNVVYFIGK